MKGTRPLDNQEIMQVYGSFTGEFADRNQCLFMIGVSIGGRIDELLSLKVKDLYQRGKYVKDVLFTKEMVKGGEVSRAVPLNKDGRIAVGLLMGWHKAKFGTIDPEAPAFASRVKAKNGSLKRMTTQAASNALMAAFEVAGLNGKLGTHSMRKSFAQRLYSQTGDIFVVQEMLGHKDVATTQKYLGVNYKEVRQALELMSVAVGGDEPVEFQSVHRASDAELIAELSKRGYTMKEAMIAKGQREYRQEFEAEFGGDDNGTTSV